MFKSVIEKKKLIKHAVSTCSIKNVNSTRFNAVKAAVGDRNFWLIGKAFIAISSPTADAIEYIEGDHYKPAKAYEVIDKALKETLVAVNDCCLDSEVKEDLIDVSVFLHACTNIINISESQC